MYSVSAPERETIIRFDDVDKVAYIYTVNPVYIRKLDKLCAECPDQYKCVKVDEEFGAKYYTTPQKLISFRKPKSISEDDKKRKSDRMRSMQSRKNQKDTSE